MKTEKMIRLPTDMPLVHGVPYHFGDSLEGTLYGGPFIQYAPGTRRLVGLKMAKEIDHPHEFKVDTADFSVPSIKDMQAGILFALKAFDSGKDVYVGCMGGVGRTGLFMGCMAKVAFEAPGVAPRTQFKSDPVKLVRHYYKAHAIETQQQMDYVRGFDTAQALAWLEKRRSGRVKVVEKIVTVEKVVERVVEKEVFLSPWAWAKRLWLTGAI